MRASKLGAVAAGAVLLAATAARGEPLEIGATMPATHVKMGGVDGREISLANAKGKAGTLVVFSCNHCPFVKAWQDRMVAIANEAVKKDLGVVFVNSNDPASFPEDDLAHMKQLADEKAYAFPYVVDATAAVASAFGATRTPEAFLFNAEGKLAYHGTIDDSTYDAAKVKKTYLKDAVDAVLAGKPVAEAQTKSVGCSIKFRTPPAK